MTHCRKAISMRSASRLLLSALLLAAVTATAADMKLEARLVWGTDDEKGGPNCKPVNEDLAAKLHGMFKWKSYFNITNQFASIPVSQTRDLKMSDHCTLRVKNLGGSRVEISCIGEGKQVHKGAYTLTPPKWLVLGGSDKDNTAWFIGLRSESANGLKNISKN
jgi:hypothetical protein